MAASIEEKVMGLINEETKEMSPMEAYEVVLDIADSLKIFADALMEDER